MRALLTAFLVAALVMLPTRAQAECARTAAIANHKVAPDDVNRWWCIDGAPLPVLQQRYVTQRRLRLGAVALLVGGALFTVIGGMGLPGAIFTEGNTDTTLYGIPTGTYVGFGLTLALGQAAMAAGSIMLVERHRVFDVTDGGPQSVQLVEARF